MLEKIKKWATERRDLPSKVDVRIDGVVTVGEAVSPGSSVYSIMSVFLQGENAAKDELLKLIEENE